MGKSAPSSPDPVQTATAQSTLDHTNQITPWGNSTYAQTGTADGVPQYTQTTSLSPTQQQLFNTQQQNALTASTAGGSLANQVANNFSQPFNPGGTALSYGAQGGQIQNSVPSGGQIQTQVGGGNTNQQIQQAQNAAYNTQAGYLTPQYTEQNNQLAASLANQGITVGSTAYNNAMDDASRNQTFGYQQAQNAAVTAGDTEQNTLYGQNLSSAQFANNAQAQQYGENLSSAQFGNQAEQQGYNQNYQNAGLNNSANAQNFQQQSYLQQLPLNEYNALMSSSQVQSPQFSSTGTPPNLMGQINQNYQNQLGSYNNSMSGLYGLGGTAAMAAMLM